MVELRPDGRQWTLVNRSIPDFKSVIPCDEQVVAYSSPGRHALTPSFVRKKTKTLLSAIWEKGLIIEDIAQWGRSYCLMMLAESWGK